jgi:hypothetical protein
MTLATIDEEAAIEVDGETEEQEQAEGDETPIEREEISEDDIVGGEEEAEDAEDEFDDDDEDEFDDEDDDEDDDEEDET